MRRALVLLSCLALLTTCAVAPVNAAAPAMISEPDILPIVHHLACTTPTSARNIGFWASFFTNGNVPPLIAATLLSAYKGCSVVDDFIPESSFVENYPSLDAGGRMDVRSYHSDSGIRYFATATWELHA